MITKNQLRVKRCFDVLLAIILLAILSGPILITVCLIYFDIGLFGFFTQERVGQNGTLFKIYKLHTLKGNFHQLGQINKSATKLGRFLRRYRINEWPQLFNVLKGDMSFVGPRPDVLGFADVLEGDDRIILMVKPGITGPATLKYKNEERVLERQKDPDHYNRTIIWADKVKINKNYVRNYSFSLDLACILKSTLNI